MKKSAVYAVLVVIMCAALVATVSAATVDFGKNNQLFTQKGAVSQVPGTPGTMDTVKAVPNYLDFYTMIKPSAAIPYVYKPGSSGLPNFNVYRPALPVYIPVITPVPQQGNGVTSVPGTSNSTLGGLIIRGDEEGDYISMRSNFYLPNEPLCNGRWHKDVGTTPAYWENKVPPGSYTIKVAVGSDLSGVYDCETVTVVAGQTTIIEAHGGLCGFCSSSCY